MPNKQTTTTRSPEMRQHHDELERFLTKLSIAVTTGDGKAVARLWDVPAFVLGAEMATAVDSLDQVAELFAAARAQYNARGITETRPEILDEDWIDDNLVVVKVRWPYLDENSREVGAEASDYTIARDGSGKLRLRIAVMRGVEGTVGTRS